LERKTKRKRKKKKKKTKKLMILANQDQMSRDKLIISVNLLNEETKEQVTKLFAKSKRVR